MIRTEITTTAPDGKVWRLHVFCDHLNKDRYGLPIVNADWREEKTAQKIVCACGKEIKP